MFDPKTLEFLEAKNPGTRDIYRAGLLKFQEFYLAEYQGSIPDFIDKLYADRDKGWRENNHIASKTIAKFVTWLRPTKEDHTTEELEKTKIFSRKTVRVYVSAIQQLAKYHSVPFSTNDAKLPASNPDLKKYPWTIEEAVRFFNLFESQMYKSMGVLIFQSFLDCSTTLSLTYGDIQKEYEAKSFPLCFDTERFKTKIPFMSFIGKWGVNELSKRLEPRLKEGLFSDGKLFPTSKVQTCAYFRNKAELFLGKKFKDNERNTCGSHSLRAGGSTLARDSTTGNSEHVRAVDRYLDFFMGKTVEEQKRVYSSKGKEGWRETWRTCVEPYVTPKDF